MNPHIRIIIAAAFALIATLAPAAIAEPDETPALTEIGVHVLGTCETDNRPHIEGQYDGEHQWLLTTWNMAVAELGWSHLHGVTPNWVDQATQRQVARSWWQSPRHAGIETQWPNCYDDALRAMGYTAPCIGRNVWGCNAPHRPELAALIAAGNAPTPPIPNFTG